MHLRVFLGSSIFALLACAGSAEPSFDCAKAASSAEELICADDPLAALDRRLAERYAAALDAIETLDSGRSQALDDLKATQRGWIKGRDECWKAEELRGCVADAYLTREAVLVATWMLEDPFAIVSYACEGNPANEVVAFFFDTERAALRLEYGDSIKAAWQVPAASGSKYALPFGGEFWTKGNDAQFAWVEGDTMQCSVSN